MTSRARSFATRRFLAVIGAACVSLSAVTGLADAVRASAAAEATVVLDRNHTDALSVRYENDALVLKTRADLDSGPGRILDPAQVLFHVTDELKDTVPDLPAFSFLGEAGAPIWRISQTYQPGVLWAGWETESLPRGVFASEQVRIRLQEISGPGRVELFVNEVQGPRRLLSSTDASLRTITENVGAHTHANWVFTAAGTHTFTFVAEADLVDGRAIRSEPQTYTFLVGAPDPQPSQTPAPQPSSAVTDPGRPDPTPSPTESDPGQPSPIPSPSATVVPSPTASPAPTDSVTPEPAPTPVDPTVAPERSLPAPDPAALTDGSRGGVTVSSPTVAPGATVTVTTTTAPASHWVSPWLLSAPVDLGWKQVNDEGAFTVAIPPDTAVGAHRIVVRDTTAALVGWTEIDVVAAEAAVEECVPTPVTTTVRPENVDVATGGHFDFGPVREGGTLRALIKDDRSAPAPWVDPATLVFHLPDAAAVQVPGGQFDFLGSGQVWQIPLTQQPDVPWLGWNTQHPSVAGRAQGPVTLTLDGLEGPGELAVYSVNSWGQLGARYFGTVSGFPRSTSIEVGPSGVHVHGIWAFTQPGAYHADLTFAGTIDGERVTATSTLTFFVGAGDPRSAVREQTVTTYVGRTASGAECELSLAATGPADPQSTTDLASLAGAALVVGLAFLGASALAPRRRT
ncbi:TIGR03773 family transporter-associated surface protein [Microbacterium sp. BWT-B31]|uniref:TIGR03773 family transporter-associated surface protein n=1 Tax=Microbacterium sp. BWT-B31 TaxID=3232072 RepID=UPI0035291C16